MHLFDLKNKTVLITGAASGLGEHFAYLCLSAGAKVIVTARKLKQLDSFKASKNKDIFLLEMDVSLKSSVTDGLEQLEKHHKKIIMIKYLYILKKPALALHQVIVANQHPIHYIQNISFCSLPCHFLQWEF